VKRPQDDLDSAFRIAVWVKGVDGALEIVGGVLLLFVAPSSLRHVVQWATAHELAQDPHDFIARHLLHSANVLSPGRTLYGAVYLLGHGVAKVVLVVEVLRNRLWAYAWMIGLLFAFIAYQTYQLSQHATIFLIALTIFDVVVVLLTIREYHHKRAAVSP
jgi:uncharacterized membrane protein